MVQGAGIDNGGSLELHGVLVTNNSGSATGPSGSAQGGGIWNGMPFAPDGPTPHLVLENTLVTRQRSERQPWAWTSRAAASTRMASRSLAKNTLIVHNVPDQCFGC